MINIEEELLLHLLNQEEDQLKHQEYQTELSFYDLVKQGKVEKLQTMSFSLTDKGLGKLSNNYTSNLLYHFIVCVAMITRFCIEGGMNSEIAYTLSDLYIQTADKLKKSETIMMLHRQMVFDYAYRMKQLQKNTVRSNHVSLCIDWIENNLTKPISVFDISNALHLNKSYLCTLFKKETGITIGSYIERRRIELAQDYLCYTEYSFVEISNLLGFSSHSHFIQTFKKQTGTTPGKYRQNHFGKHFNQSEATYTKVPLNK